MTDFSKLVPEHVRALGVYPPGKPLRQAEQESGIRCIKMASNENPFGPSPRALEAMQAAAADSHLYPENDCPELRLKLAAVHGVKPEQVLVTAGSTSLLNILARTLLAPGLNAITSRRSFIIYPLATRAAGARLLEVPTCNDGYDLEAIAAAVDGDTRVIYIANPNNPTGTMLDAPACERFLDRIPEHVLVVLDEAYCDFAEFLARQRGVEYSRSLDYVRQERNVVVLRTFSKVHGLAGARVGYGLGPAALLQYFARLRTVFSVSNIAMAGATAALEDKAHIRQAVENNAAQAPWLAEKIREMGFRVIPTWANFLYCELGEDAAGVGRRLQAEGVIIRPLNAWGAPNAIRVTVGTPQQNQTFLNAFRKVMESTARPVGSQ